jgi:hypothetical protein
MIPDTNQTNGLSSQGVSHWVVFVGVGLTAFLIYLFSLAPTLSWQHGTDGGDLITAASVLGVPHPPGYPLYVLVGHLWSLLPWPEGNLAFGFNVLSAVCAAIAAATLAAAVIQWSSLFSGLLAGLTFAFGPAIWSQAIIAEVYAMNCLVLAALLFVVLARRPGGGLLWSLSWSTHLTSIFFLPLAWWWGKDRIKTNHDRWHILCSFLLGLSLFLVPPLLATRRPVINWGDPVTPARWWWLVSGALYRGYAFGLPLVALPGRLSTLARLTVQHLTWPGVALCLWGIGRLWNRRRSFAVVLLLTAFSVSLWSVGYNTTDSDLLLIPAWMIGAVILGLGEWELNHVSAAWRRLRWLALLIPIALVLSGWSEASLRGEWEAAAWGQIIMSEAPANALVYSATDAHTFALWYYRHAEQQRSDLTIVDQDMLGEEWYDTMLRAQDQRWPDQLAGRSVCVLSPSGILACEQ